MCLCVSERKREGGAKESVMMISLEDDDDDDGQVIVSKVQITSCLLSLPELFKIF